ncbi:ester cyclase [Chloroflexota bacterium]
MSVKENKEMYEQVIDGLNASKGDAAKIRSTLEKHCAPGFTIHRGRQGDMNLDQAVQHYVEIWAAFPDFKLSIDNMVAEEDKVAIRATGQGTHKGTYMGIPATGKQVKTTAMQINKIVWGKSVEIWELVDGLGMMIQLGVIPDPASKK